MMCREMKTIRNGDGGEVQVLQTKLLKERNRWSKRRWEVWARKFGCWEKYIGKGKCCQETWHETSTTIYHQQKPEEERDFDENIAFIIVYV